MGDPVSRQENHLLRKRLNSHEGLGWGLGLLCCGLFFRVVLGLFDFVGLDSFWFKLSPCPCASLLGLHLASAFGVLAIASIATTLPQSGGRHVPPSRLYSR